MTPCLHWIQTTLQKEKEKIQGLYNIFCLFFRDWHNINPNDNTTFHLLRTRRHGNLILKQHGCAQHEQKKVCKMNECKYPESLYTWKKHTCQHPHIRWNIFHQQNKMMHHLTFVLFVYFDFFFPATVIASSVHLTVAMVEFPFYSPFSAKIGLPVVLKFCC